MACSRKKSSKFEPRCLLLFRILPLLPALLSQRNVVVGRFLCLLDETVQQNELIAVDYEQDPGDPISEARPDLPYRPAQMIDARFPQRPFELHVRDVCPDQFALVPFESL